MNRPCSDAQRTGRCHPLRLHPPDPGRAAHPLRAAAPPGPGACCRCGAAPAPPRLLAQPPLAPQLSGEARAVATQQHSWRAAFPGILLLPCAPADPTATTAGPAGTGARGGDAASAPGWRGPSWRAGWPTGGAHPAADVAAGGPGAAAVGAARAHCHHCLGCRGRFRLLSIAGQGYGGKAGLAAALFCRYHGRHVELAVSSTAAAARQEQEVHGGDSGHDGAFDAPLSSDDDDDDLPSAVEEGEVVLAVWAPQACTAEGWGLYEFELACGELYAREGGIQRGHGAHMPCLAGVRSLLAACSSSPTPVPHVTGCRLAALRGRPRAGASR